MNKSDKRRYVTLYWTDVGTVTCLPETVQDYLNQADMPPGRTGEVWLTQAEWEALPEFQS